MIKYAFFRDFKSSDSVLFDGDPQDLIGFSDLLRRIAVGDIQGALTLDDKVGCHPTRATSVSIHTTPNAESRCVLISASSDGVVLAWYLSPTEAKVAEDLVTGLEP